MRLLNHKFKIGLFINCNDMYGRNIILGIARYANMERRWILFKDLTRGVDNQFDWPMMDGGIFAGMPDTLLELGYSRCRHVVSCSGGMDLKKIPKVAMDDYAVGVLGANHFIDLRLTQFAFYGAADIKYLVAQRRLAGFRETLDKRGFVVNVCPVFPPNSSQHRSHDHRPALIRWLKELPKPVGIICSDDTMAHDLTESCLEAEISVPEQIAILGVNNDDFLCESAWPPLSSVQADFQKVGYTAARMLDRLLQGEKIKGDEREVRLPPLGVVQRQSTNILAVEDPNVAETIRFIREHACQNITINDILRAVPVGRRWLERHFDMQFGRSLHDEILRVRIETAKRLMQDPKLTLETIAKKSGFTEIKSFYRAFKKIVNETPAKYRRTFSIENI